MGDECEDFPFFFDDDFVRENLSFLMEDDFFEPNLGTSLHYRSYEEENSIYNTAKINTNVLTSWSSSSSGSISSIREQTSQYVNICLRLEMKNQFQCSSSHTGFSLPDSGFLETSNLHDNSFLLDFPTNLTSTPTKRGRNEYVERVQVLGDKDNQSQVENATGLTTVQNSR
nr:uncharacterized protein LOC111514959 [Leptinotarsa decemlineata]